MAEYKGIKNVLAKFRELLMGEVKEQIVVRDWSGSFVATSDSGRWSQDISIVGGYKCIAYSIIAGYSTAVMWGVEGWTDSNMMGFHRCLTGGTVTVNYIIRCVYRKE